MTPVTREALLEELAVDECWALLATHMVGRLAVATLDGCPVVVPMNYVVSGNGIVFRTDDGTKLRAIGNGRASFEVDAVDPHRGTGWSVLVRGDVYEATSWELAGVTLDAWAPGPKRLWLRLAAREVTGRRLDVAGFEPDERGYL